MEELQLLDAVERYFRGEMSPKKHFEPSLRKNIPVDQFIGWTHDVPATGETSSTYLISNPPWAIFLLKLLESGEIGEKAPKATVLRLLEQIQKRIGGGFALRWCRYYRHYTSVITWYFLPHNNVSEIRQLSRELKVKFYNNKPMGSSTTWKIIQRQPMLLPK